MNAPETPAATPGQAAYVAAASWEHESFEGSPFLLAAWERLSDRDRKCWDDVAAAAIAARQPQPAPGLLQSAYLYHCKFGGLGGDEYGLFWRKEDADAAAANRAGEGRTEVLGMAILGDQPEQPATGLAGDTEPVMAPAVVRPLFGSVLVLALHPDQDDEAARRGEEAIRAATAGDGVTVVTVRGVEALRTWEPPTAPTTVPGACPRCGKPALGTAWRLLDEARATLSRVRAVAEVAARGEVARLPESPKGTLARQVLEEMDPQ